MHYSTLCSALEHAVVHWGVVQCSCVPCLIHSEWGSKVAPALSSTGIKWWLQGPHMAYQALRVTRGASEEGSILPGWWTIPRWKDDWIIGRSLLTFHRCQQNGRSGRDLMVINVHLFAFFFLDLLAIHKDQDFWLKFKLKLLFLRY